jgi:hypothetical protein
VLLDLFSERKYFVREGQEPTKLLLGYGDMLLVIGWHLMCHPELMLSSVSLTLKNKVNGKMTKIQPVPMTSGEDNG